MAAWEKECFDYMLCSPLRSSWVSVVFDFNASHNCIAPVSPILFPVSMCEMKVCLKCTKQIASFMDTSKAQCRK